MNQINPTTNPSIPEPDDGASVIQTDVPARENETNAFEPKQAAGLTPGVTPERIPEATPEVTTENTTQDTPGRIPEATPENTPEVTMQDTTERTADQTGLHTKDTPELPASNSQKSQTTARTEPEQNEGSLAIKPCTNIGILGTATKELLSKVLPVTDSDQMITLPAVPLYLIAPVLSREIHTYKGVISEVLIRRVGQHRYQITLVTRAQAQTQAQTQTPTQAQAQTQDGVPDAD